MNKTQIALATALIASVSTLAHAQEAAPAAAPAPASDWTFTGNMALSSDYRTRGISQSDKKPALSGGFDVSHSSGFYFGNWNSNIDSTYYQGANIEMDFYGGFKYPVGPVTLDLGAFYYYYPGSGRKASNPIESRGVDNKEIYVAASYSTVTAKFYYPIGDFFSFQKNSSPTKAGRLKSAEGSYYLDISGSYDLGNGFGLIGHFGYQKLEGAAKAIQTNSTKLAKDYEDWKLGVTYSFANGFVATIAYIDTSIDTPNVNVSSTRSLSGATGVFSLSKTF
ncbi:MAG: TorF family putative porin [Burkholderiales bacterium]